MKGMENRNVSSQEEIKEGVSAITREFSRAVHIQSAEPTGTVGNDLATGLMFPKDRIPITHRAVSTPNEYVLVNKETGMILHHDMEEIPNHFAGGAEDEGVEAEEDSFELILLVGVDILLSKLIKILNVFGKTLNLPLKSKYPLNLLQRRTGS